MSRYAAENYSLREENRHLRSLESVRRAEEAAGQAAAELEEAFHRAQETERQTRSKTRSFSIRERFSKCKTISRLDTFK